MNLCQSNRELTKEIKEFLLNVGDVKEESITDYLVWKWKEIDKRFKSISVSTFTRQEESKVSGADFEMEIWLIGKKKSYPLVIQAKKFIKPYDAYVSKLNYPKNTKGQMNKLLSYAALNNKLPFYVFYSLPDKKTRTMCRSNDVHDCGVFLACANDIEKFADGKYGKRVSKNNILKKSNPFHCIFCCPLSFHSDYFETYFNATESEGEDVAIPKYINYLLEAHPLELDARYIKSLIKEYELENYRYIAAYDMRDNE